jgi:DNA-binding helix-hairpin-helix protein with protein kinase domain
MIALRSHKSGVLHLFDESRDLLAKGAEGKIYNVTHDVGLVAKVYLPMARRASETQKEFAARAATTTAERHGKLKAMLREPPNDGGNVGHVSIAWPTDLLVDPDTGGGFRGFLMKRIPKDARALAAFTRPERRRADLKDLGHHHAYTTASNVARVFGVVHRSGFVVGDVSYANVLARRDGLVSLVDTDSFQVTDPRSGQVFRCPVGTPDFTPPELQGANFRMIDRKVEHDLFGLAVLLFQLLMNGEHPFDGTTSLETHGGWTRGDRIRQKTNFPYGPEQSPFQFGPIATPLASLDSELQELFLKCFTTGLRDPAKRPDASAWSAAIERAEGRLKQCTRNKVHAYGGSLKTCPHCKVEKELQERAARDAHRRETKKKPSPVALPKWPFPPPSSSPFSLPLMPLPQHPPPPPPPPPPPKPWIVPGHWQILPSGPDPRASLAAALAPSTYNLLAGGELVGKFYINAGALGIPDMNMSMSLAGRWWHDASTQTLSLDYVMTADPMSMYGMAIPVNVPPQRVSQQFRITGRTGASFTATDQGGGQFEIIRL